MAPDDTTNPLDQPESVAHPAVPSEDELASKAQERFEILQKFGAGLDAKFTEYFNQRNRIERIWLEDLRAFYGQYDPDVEQELKAANSSRLFINITRPKTNAFIARMQDMLLPTDDKNWGLTPTPIPNEGDLASDETSLVGADGKQATTPQGEPIQVRDLVAGIKEAAADAMKLMEEQIDDRLSEAGYNPIVRKALEQMAILGTGVIEGPVQIVKQDQQWTKQGENWSKVAVDTATVPSVEWVDVWDFFPDMSAPYPESWRDGFRRYYQTDRELRVRAKRMGFDPIALQEVLDKRGRLSVLEDSHLAQLRSIQGINNWTDDRFRLLKYIGPVDDDMMQAIGMTAKNDPFSIEYAIIWMCNGIVLKVSPYFLDSANLPWAVCYCEKDTLSPFGWGIPRLMRGEQKTANAAWRMMIDNSGLSTGPQTVMDLQAVTPADGNPNMSPRKLWLKHAETRDVPVKNVFDQFTVDSHQQELMNIFDLALRMADEVTMLPMIVQGDQAPHMTKTAQGLAMLNNNANIVQKRAVKSFDDWLTVPLLTRMYDWEMQFNDRQEIKVDCQVLPKGASVLLEKEQQSQTLMQFMQFKGSAWDPYFDWYKVAEQVAKNLRITDVMATEDEAKAGEEAMQKAAAAAQQQQGAAAPAGGNPNPTPDEVALREREIQSREQLHTDQVASKERVSQREAAKAIAVERMRLDHKGKEAQKERMHNAGMTLAKTQMATAGPRVQPTPISPAVRR
jgi:hypothetical protein